MKKLFLIVAVIFSLFLISCGDSDSGDSGNTGADDTANTGSDDDTGDTGNTGSDDDTGNTGNTGSDDDGTGEIVYECVGISIENIALNQEYMTYEGSTSVGDETLEDLFSLQFYKEDLSPQDALTVGTYDLATGLNENYTSCTECTLIYEDLAEDGSGYAKYFYQMEGTLEITEVKEGTMESKGTLTAKVVEVTIDGSTYESTPVAGGSKLHLTPSAFRTAKTKFAVVTDAAVHAETDAKTMKSVVRMELHATPVQLSHSAMLPLVTLQTLNMTSGSMTDCSHLRSEAQSFLTTFQFSSMLNLKQSHTTLQGQISQTAQNVYSYLRMLIQKPE